MIEKLRRLLFPSREEKMQKLKEQLEEERYKAQIREAKQTAQTKTTEKGRDMNDLNFLQL